MAVHNLTRDRLLQVLDYDPDTGVFRWKTTGKGRRPDLAAGTLRTDGYIYICIDFAIYKSHRLAWLYVHGRWPEHHIDHANGDRADNRIGNLRDVPNKLNSQNRHMAQSNSKSGLLGVVWKKRTKRWIAVISINGKQKQIGSFLSAQEAHSAYLLEKRRVHPGFVPRTAS